MWLRNPLFPSGRDTRTRRAGPIRWFGENSGDTAVRQGLPEVYPRLWRFCLVLCGERANADDLAQKTCVQALRYAERFTPGTHLDRWLFTIARRTFLNDVRGEKIRRGEGLVLVEDVEISDEKPSLETNILAHEVLNRVSGLPEGQRMAVLLVYVEGYSYAEAAEELEIPIGTVMSRLAAARGKIAVWVRGAEGA